MRILHVVPSFGLGGMEKIVSALINNTRDYYDHDVLALDGCIHASNWITDKGVRFVDFQKPVERRKFFHNLYRFLGRTKPDFLMTYNWGATDAIWLGRLAGIRRVIHSEHGFNVDESKTTYWKRDAARCLVYRLAARVIVVSSDFEALLRRRYLLKVTQVMRISNGIDTRYYSPDPTDRDRTRRRLGFAETDVVIGFSGRLDPVKNLEHLLDIFSAGLRVQPHLRLLIVGDGPVRKRLETMCRETDIYGHVVFSGEQENVLPYLRAMDIFLLTSLREQMPMTVLEAMGVGIPVIATKVGEVPNIVDHGVNGFVLDGDAPAEPFVELLLTLLCPERRKDMGDAARRKIASHFQEQAMIQQYKSVIQGLK